MAARICGHNVLSWPQCPVVLAAYKTFVERQQSCEFGEEPGFKAADGDVACVRRLIGIVEGRAGIEQVRAAHVTPQARCHQGVHSVVSIEAPSVIAASITWPLPERERSNRAASAPATSITAPPP